MNKAKRVFAIRSVSGWVELRSSSVPLQGVKTTFNKTVMESITTYEVVGTICPSGWPKYELVTRQVPKKVNFPIVHWKGGRLLGMIDAAKANQTLGILLKPNVCAEVNPVVAKRILNWRWRRKVLGI